MKLGIFGGTFNPPHLGHVKVAGIVRSTLFLDKIIFVPSYITPHKQVGEEILAQHRLAMMKIAIGDYPFFDVLDYEINRQDTSYTVNTLQFLEKNNPIARLFLIVGMDNYLTFHQWKDYKKILEQATLVVMNRPNFPKQMNEAVETKNIVFVEVPNIDISSSEVRQKIKKGRTIRDDVGEKVEEYIEKYGLYK